jgi:hypothetical protein
MPRRFRGICVSAILLLLTPLLLRAATAPPNKKAPPAPTPAAKLDALGLARHIDQFIEGKFAEGKVKAASPATDAEFIRRLAIDLAGRIPTILEVRDFLDDDRPNKREIWVERFLEQEMYPRHFANVFRALMLPEDQGNFQVLQFTPQFENWLREHLQKNTPYDKMVRELLTGQPFANNNTANVNAFYQASEFKPENLAGSTSRIFLGVKLECAQCHDHPFSRWTRKDFWEYAAFFTNMQSPVRRPGFQPQQNGKIGEIKIPGTDKTVKARFLKGDEPKLENNANLRNVLTDWMVKEDNPFFARALVDHLWSYFFGLSLIEPIDEPNDDVIVTHPEMLDELARQFVAHKYDVKYLIRAITSTKAYQRSSKGNPEAREEVVHFARMSIRGLSPEQMFDSVAETSEYKESVPQNQFQFNPFLNTPRRDFLSKFAGQEKRIDSTTSILQALFMMNSKFMNDLTSVEKNKTLHTIVEHKESTTAQRIERIFLVVLSRPPRSEELSRLVQYVDRGGARNDSRRALADVYWALLNSAEFKLNR